MPRTWKTVAIKSCGRIGVVLGTSALAGGGLKMGQVVGESNAKAEVPKTTPIRPQDLMATVFHVLGMPRDLHYNDPSGRPTAMITNGTAIRELV